ncbi:hypothetical protein BD410DRAFT_155754 [Rickenella mellea]|uniref:WD40 repeat-like protein n=1 Tax=Rickenella mellea TaxID=50990 RepID=A0A4Y7PK08_9AGAM|nr:hypothetical protein BD410DRAFT_155754 [Rickenella mellea]
MQGKYTITNVRYRNAVHLPESGEGDDLKVGSRDDQTYIWDIEQLPRNAKYLIKSCAQARGTARRNGLFNPSGRTMMRTSL